jgi:transposase-like protein
MIENISTIDKLKIVKRRKAKFTDEQRKKYCKDYADSGLSIKDYCELSKVSQSALRKWINKFPTKRFFTPINAKPSMNTANTQAFEIIFPNGIRLKFSELVDATVIKQLIKEIGTCI